MDAGSSPAAISERVIVPKSILLSNIQVHCFLVASPECNHFRDTL